MIENGGLKYGYFKPPLGYCVLLGAQKSSRHDNGFLHAVGWPLFLLKQDYSFSPEPISK
jgi:hypothetical protein